MGGAYTAKPDASIAPVVPDGWNPEWTFPGVFPPGYAAVYSLGLTAPESVVPGATVAVTGKLYDHVTFRTNEPAGSVLTWDVTVDGVVVPLRIGGGAYGAEAVSVYVEDVNEFWGAVPTLDIQFTSEHAGKTAVLTAMSVVAGATVTKTANITVGVTIEILITTSHTLNQPETFPYEYDELSCSINVDDDGSGLEANVFFARGYVPVFFYYDNPVAYSEFEEGSASVNSSGGTISVTVEGTDSFTIIGALVLLSVSLPPSQLSWSCVQVTNVNIIVNGVDHFYNKTLSISGNSWTSDSAPFWLRVNNATGEIIET